MDRNKQLPLIIGITGFIRSGKSTASKYLSDRYGYIEEPNVKVLRNIVRAVGLPLSRDNLAAVGDALFAELGRDIIAKARVDNVINQASPNAIMYVIDGIRYPEELVVFRKLDSFKLLAIDCADNIRYERTLIGDLVKDGSLSFNEFLKLNDRQSEQHVRQIMKEADHTIVNEEGREEFQYRLDSFIEGL